MFGDQLKLNDEIKSELGCGHVQLLKAIAAGQFDGAKKILCPDCNNWITLPEKQGFKLEVEGQERGGEFVQSEENKI